MRLRRYQRGHIYKTGEKVKVWYGMYREDVHKPDGKIVRRQRNIRLGTLGELPTRAAAYDELSQRMGQTATSVELKFSELVGRWKAAVMPTTRMFCLHSVKRMFRTLADTM